MAAIVALAATLGAGIVVVALRPSGKRPAATAAPPPPAPVVTGSLEVVSDPAGAAVEIDGSPRGVDQVPNGLSFRSGGGGGS